MEQPQSYSFNSIGELINGIQNYKTSRKRRKVENKYVYTGEYNQDMEN